MEGEIKIKTDYQIFGGDCKWHGMKGYMTNSSLSRQEVTESYNDLCVIEKAFRISKTDVKIKQIYHRLRNRIDSYMCISFVSYLVF